MVDHRGVSAGLAVALLRSLLVVSLLALTVGCGGATVGCAAGTSADPNGVCVSTALLAGRCGEGTEWNGTACVLSAADASADTGAPADPDAAVEPDDTGATGDEDTLTDEDLGGGEPCTPSCEGRQCGDDGCGGSCGTCEFLSDTPICWDGACVPIPTCTADCTGRVCGDDGCGGSCGACGVLQGCVAGACVPLEPKDSCSGRCGLSAPGGCRCDEACGLDCCGDFEIACNTCVPACDGRNCGDDGCGGTCGSCGVGQSCSEAGICVDDPCSPDPCSGHGTCGAGGACDCNLGYSGDACEACFPGFVGYPDCVPSACGGQTCSFHGTCQEPTGACQCDEGFAGAACDACAPPNVGYPACAPPSSACCGTQPGMLGCEPNVACETCVCTVDSSCCLSEWGDACSTLATGDCAAACACGG